MAIELPMEPSAFAGWMSSIGQATRFAPAASGSDAAGGVGDGFVGLAVAEGEAVADGVALGVDVAVGVDVAGDVGDAVADVGVLAGCVEVADVLAVGDAVAVDDGCVGLLVGDGLGVCVGVAVGGGVVGALVAVLVGGAPPPSGEAPKSVTQYQPYVDDEL